MLVEESASVQVYIHTEASTAMDWDEGGVLVHCYHDSIALGHIPCAVTDDYGVVLLPAPNRSRLPQEQRLPLDYQLVHSAEVRQARLLPN